MTMPDASFDFSQREEPAAMPDRDLESRIMAALRSIYDPEIPVNIVDLGLIYDLKIAPDGAVVVAMTLTTPNCPVAASMPSQVETAVKGVEGVTSTRVDLVWTPPWSPDQMTEEARLELGLY